MRREYAGISATMLGFIFIAFLRDWFTSGHVPTSICYVYWVVGAFGLSLIFRTLKHNTNLLFEEDRS
jgi:hypothetical protein